METKQDQPLESKDVVAAGAAAGFIIPQTKPAFYTNDRTAAGAGIRDAYGTSYVIEPSGAIRRVGPKKAHRTL